MVEATEVFVNYFELNNMRNLTPSLLIDIYNILLRLKFDYPHTQSMTKWILQSINSKWRNLKSDLKFVHYDSSNYMSNHSINIPNRVSRD